MKRNKVVIIAPFWRDHGHVGVRRVDRFVRWLSGAGVTVILVCRGARHEVMQTAWGYEIAIVDPLEAAAKRFRSLVHRFRANGRAGSGVPENGASTANLGGRRTLAGLLSEWLLVPDTSAPWAERAARDRDVLEFGADADWVISSSPPEGIHCGADKLARSAGAQLAVDLRDGWIDEPLRAVLRAYAGRRWYEARIEKRILINARAILVTSEEWKTMMQARLPFTAEKTAVLTNAYPMRRAAQPAMSVAGGPCRLLHVGRFSGSHASRTVGYLLEPLLAGIVTSHQSGSVTLLGPLTCRDTEEIEHWRPRFLRHDWQIDAPGPVPAAAALEAVERASGLLLPSNSPAAIPSKFFEYVPTRRPILAVTPRNSALWKVCENLPQAFLADSTDPGMAAAAVVPYLTAAGSPTASADVPAAFSEEVLSRNFCAVLGY